MFETYLMLSGLKKSINRDCLITVTLAPSGRGLQIRVMWKWLDESYGASREFDVFDLVDSDRIRVQLAEFSAMVQKRIDDTAQEAKFAASRKVEIA